MQSPAAQARPLLWLLGGTEHTDLLVFPKFTRTFTQEAFLKDFLTGSDGADNQHPNRSTLSLLPAGYHENVTGTV